MEQRSKGNTNRRNFLVNSAAAAGLALYPETLLFAQATGASSAPSSTTLQNPSANTTANKPRPDPLKPELVKEFVVAAHGDLEKTKACWGKHQAC